MARRRESGREAPELPLGKRLAFAVLAVSAGLLVLEGGARLLVPARDVPTHEEHARLITVLGLPALNDVMEFDPDLFWRLKPELREFRVAGRIREHPIDFAVTTSESLRSPPVAKVKSRYRVLALGDSCTFGVGVGGDATWPARLERMLREAGVEAEVINAGVPGYTAYQGKRFLETRGLALDPDLVLVAFGFNDADRGMPASDAETARTLATGRFHDALLRSRLAYGLKLLLAAPRSSSAPGGAPRLTETEFYETLDEIRDLSASRGAGTLVVVWPYEAQVRERVPDFVRYQIPAARFCREREVDGVNLVTAFLRESAPLYIDHIHANAEGNRAAAAAILPWVLERAAAAGRPSARESD